MIKQPFAFLIFSFITKAMKQFQNSKIYRQK